jgi:AcrR family transcriptional regulator
VLKSFAFGGSAVGGNASAYLPPSFDPSSPIFMVASGAHRNDQVRPDKRYRRSCILAAIRKLLMQRGAQGITIREIAKHSGYSVQTIYNLAGRQNEAIEDALAEYSHYVMQESVPNPSDPHALFAILNSWLETIKLVPQYCIESSQVFFSEATRGLYYKNRQCHARGMTTLLREQMRCGIIRRDVNVEELAEQLILFSSASCLEWSADTISLDRLRVRLYSGFASLISDKVEVEYRGTIEKRLL